MDDKELALIERIYEFLVDHNDQAFSLSELAKAMNIPDIGPEITSISGLLDHLRGRPNEDVAAQRDREFMLALIQLTGREHIEERSVARNTYYAQGAKPLPVGTGNNDSSG